jgi:histidinol-phosphate aminotransferase
MQAFNLEDIIRKNIKELIPYSSARSEFEGDGQIFLDANENSLGSPLNENFHRYPDPLQKELKEKISGLKNLPTQNIFVGNGSDEAIDLLIRAFCTPSLDNILIFPPTYGMYEVCAAVNDVSVKKVVLAPGFQLNLDGALKAIDSNTRLIFICSPNNPTGNLIGSEDIESLLQNFNGIVVIDEAYIDFADTASWLKKINTYPNLVVLQTLSKAWGLAALRIGLAFASQEIISILNKIKSPYNVSGITQALALKALVSKKNSEEKISIIIAEKKRLERTLPRFDFVEEVFPSDANFLLVKVNDATRIYNYLLTKNIVVRNRSNQPLCENCLRITIGTPLENEQLIEALQNYCV